MEKRQTLIGAIIAVVILIVAALGVMRMRGKQTSVQPAADMGDQSGATQKAKPKKVKAKPKKPAGPEPVYHVKARVVTNKNADTLGCEDCNVILISIDALRADHLGSYGYARKTSPKLDKLAGESLLFENAISQSTWTTPAHASMLTGLLPREHGLLLYPGPGRLPPSTPTLASMLKEKGYLTASFNGGGFIGKPLGLGTGFDTYESHGTPFKRNLAAARAWLSQNGDQKFFLFLEGSDVRRPYLHTKSSNFHALRDDYDMTSFCRKNKSDVVSGDDLDYVISQYDEGVLATDSLVGDFLAFLEQEKVLDNSIVIVTADHGEEFFEHGKCDHGHSLFRELVHVPLIVHLPSKMQARVAGQVAASSSIVPTVMGMLGLSKGGKLDLRPMVHGKATQDAVISETASKVARKKGEEAGPSGIAYYKAAVTTPAWKLIYTRAHDQDTWALYDVKADPGEKTDVHDKQAAVVTRLRNTLFPPKGVPFAPTIPTSEPAATE